VPEDPYADPVTGVLRNKLGLGATGELESAEREITHAALIFLREAPVPPSYDLGHLCAIHRRIRCAAKTSCAAFPGTCSPNG
jgi:cell filamentation protein